MRNIIITGGELFNKGAQTMTFITVNEVKTRFPDHEIYVLSEMDLQRPEKERKQYAFRFMGWYPIKFAKCQSNIFLRFICMARNGKELREAEAIYKNTDMMIDISGYALGSNWSYQYCNNYLDHLEFAHAFRIPVYLMPQSFGPFDFNGDAGARLEKRIRKLLPGVRVVCAREKAGYDELINKYRLGNIRLAGDLVLNNKEIDLKNIFRVIPDLNVPHIEKDSVGIVPNVRTIEAGGEGAVLELYDAAIAELLEEEKMIYLLSHSTQDRELCKIIKSHFAGENRVILLNQEFNCFEFSKIVRQFQFVIASRFHAIVHAYKNGIPCISLGWAIKYHDLLAEFGQECYSFDVRDGVNTTILTKTISRMDENRNNEALKIKGHLASVQKDNIFDILSIEV